MGKPRKYLIKSVNFGQVNHPARLLVEKFTAENGNQKFSELMRKLALLWLSPDPEYKEQKIVLLKAERRHLAQEVGKIGAMMRSISQKLEELGEDPGNI